MDSDTESVISEAPRRSKGGKRHTEKDADLGFYERYNYLVGYIVVLVLLVLVFVGGYNFVKRMRKKRDKVEPEASWNLKEEIGKLEDRQRTLVTRSQLR